MKNFFEEFKEFAFRGNVLNLAVGVVLGSAFTAIVTSLVENIITPLLGILLGGKDFSSLSYKFGDATIAYGIFIQSILNFLLIALAIFIFIKLINSALRRFKKQEEEEEVPDAEAYLKEIRDLLMEQSKKENS